MFLMVQSIYSIDDNWGFNLKRAHFQELYTVLSCPPFRAGLERMGALSLNEVSIRESCDYITYLRDISITSGAN